MAEAAWETAFKIYAETPAARLYRSSWWMSRETLRVLAETGTDPAFVSWEHSIILFGRPVMVDDHMAPGDMALEG